MLRRGWRRIEERGSHSLLLTRRKFSNINWRNWRIRRRYIGVSELKLIGCNMEIGIQNFSISTPLREGELLESRSW
jgi:hypothetical protein